MKPQKTIEKHYLETGILGAYETTDVAHEEVLGGKVAPCFDDALVFFDTEQTTAERLMQIEGRRYHIRSIFPSEAHYTPTDKLLGLIDTELKDKIRVAQ